MLNLLEVTAQTDDIIRLRNGKEVLSICGRRDRQNKDYNFIVLSDILEFLLSENRKFFYRVLKVMENFSDTSKIILRLKYKSRETIPYSNTLKVITNLEKEKTVLLISDLVQIIDYLLIDHSVREFYNYTGFVKTPSILKELEH